MKPKNLARQLLPFTAAGCLLGFIAACSPNAATVDLGVTKENNSELPHASSNTGSVNELARALEVNFQCQTNGIYSGTGNSVEVRCPEQTTFAKQSNLIRHLRALEFLADQNRLSTVVSAQARTRADQLRLTLASLIDRNENLREQRYPNLRRLTNQVMRAYEEEPMLGMDGLDPASAEAVKAVVMRDELARILDSVEQRITMLENDPDQGDQQTPRDLTDLRRDLQSRIDEINGAIRSIVSE